MIHYYSLNNVLKYIDEKYMINYEEHLAKYDGLSTRKKLELLTQEKNLPKEYHDNIFNLKQEKTLELINTFNPDTRLIKILSELKNKGYLLYCASNSIYNTLKQTLAKKGLLDYIDFFISNEELKHPKPSPEIYYRCLLRANVSSHEVLICEDSHIGRKSALQSGCHLCPIIDPNDLTLEKILDYINISNEKNKKNNIYDLRWKGKINIVIPMAGRGSRFNACGYKEPKPLIPIKNTGKTMIETVIENLNIDGNYIFIVQKEHYEKYNLEEKIKNETKKYKIIQIDYTTEGAAASVLLAREYIDNNIPLLIANCDQFLEWDSNEFLYSMKNDIDGGIQTFYSNENKWSYVKLDNNGMCIEVKEKEVISEYATTGIYYWSNGSDFCKYAKEMIDANLRVNNEFYVAPVYNYAIQDGKKIKIKNVHKMWGIGVPTDLDFFEKNYKYIKN
jgi:HAD superfamily hydrolase (TIGR01509 family)